MAPRMILQAGPLLQQGRIITNAHFTGEWLVQLLLNKYNWEEAKKLCVQYEEEGFMDWKLPNRKEIQLIHSLLHKSQKGNFSSSSYWSITQDDSNYAVIQHFINGSQDSYPKDTNNHIRAIRYF